MAGGAAIQVAAVAGEPGARVLLSVRPETLRPVLPGDASSSVLAVRLVMREFLGPIVTLHATLPDGAPIRVAALGSHDAEPGQTLTLAYDPAQIIAYAAP
jgi:hypothetical protein